MKKTETKQIAVVAYRDSNGNPTCAKDFTTGQVCIFYRTRMFGCGEVCCLDTSTADIYRREEGRGSLIPSAKCPVWKDEEGRVDMAKTKGEQK